MGRSWGGLGGSWGLLGASWAPLVPSWGVSKRLLNMILCKNAIQNPKWEHLTNFWLSQGQPKPSQNGTQTSQNSRRFPRAKKLLFKTVLEPSWADLGAFGRPSWGQNKRLRIGTRNAGAKIKFLMKISFQDAFWIELGPTWPPKRSNTIPRWQPKTIPNQSKSM